MNQIACLKPNDAQREQHPGDYDQRHSRGRRSQPAGKQMVWTARGVRQALSMNNDGT
jgi:hypothetical protein